MLCTLIEMFITDGSNKMNIDVVHYSGESKVLLLVGFMFLQLLKNTFTRKIFFFFLNVKYVRFFD